MNSGGSGAAMEPINEEGLLSQWIELVDGISDSQKIKLIGLLIGNPNLQPTLITEVNINNDSNIEIAEKWFKQNLRELMNYYCKYFDGYRAESVNTVIDKAEITKYIAPLVVTNYSIILGIAVAFIIWAINRSVSEWCKKYGLREYSGTGDYISKFASKHVSGFMDIEHKPAIEETEQDIEAYPIKTKFIKIISPSEIKGRIKLDSKTIVNEIAIYSEKGDEQTFALNENRLNKLLKGKVSRAALSSSKEPEILRFEASEYQILDLPLK